jgi:hypothetical protein
MRGARSSEHRPGPAEGTPQAAGDAAWRGPAGVPPELPEVVTECFRNVLTFLPMAAGTAAMPSQYVVPNKLLPT